MEVQATIVDLEQRGHEEAPDPAIDAVVLIEKQPIVAVLAGQSQTRRDGERIDAMVRVVVTAEAFDAIVAALPLETVAYEPNVKTKRRASG